MRGLLLGLCLSLASCTDVSSVSCKSGNVCAEGLVCDDTHGLCVTDAQTTACASLADTDRCEAGSFAGICDQNVCISGCGDGVRGDAEECDDGNYRSHDGCSSQCISELPSWQRWQSEWVGRAAHTAAYHVGAGKLVVFGGTDEHSVTNDHWELDGTGNASWTRRDIPTPSARLGATMVYDELHQRIILFGGTPVVVTATAPGLGDTWSFDGDTWTKLTLATSPPKRWQAAMAYAGNGHIVLFGGRDGNVQLNDTWDFDGSTWTQVTSATSPSARYGAVMTWAPFTGNNRVILVASQDGGQSADQWEYRQGSGWAAILPSLPFGFRSAEMVFDPGQGSEALILFGAQGGPGVMNTTLSFNGTTWITLNTPGPPPSRIDGTLTASPDGLWLVGGAGAASPLDDVWLFYAGSWYAQGTPGRAPLRGEHELIFDSDLQQTFSIGGDAAVSSQRPTYRFDGTQWARTDKLLTDRSRFASAYDSARHQLVIFGGITSGVNNDTNVYTTSGWVNVGGPQPPQRRNGAMAFDGKTQRTVLFGGQDSNGTSLGDMWTFDTTWSQSVVSPGPGTTARGAMEYDPAAERMVLFDEQGMTWGLAANGWEQIAPLGPAPRTAAGMAFSPELGMVMFGGISTVDSSVLTDMWKLTADGWQEIDQVGERPTARQDPRLVNHRPARSLLLSSGTSASSTPLDDTWFFQYRSSTPEEECADGMDNDDDHVVDADDPDCQ